MEKQKVWSLLCGIEFGSEFELLAARELDVCECRLLRYRDRGKVDGRICWLNPLQMSVILHSIDSVVLLWLSGRTSVSGQRSFDVLHSTCS